MASEMCKRCDVFRTIKNVDTYKVEITADPLNEGKPRRLIFIRTKDLSNRALARLLNLNERGLAPPKHKTDSTNG